MNCKGDYMNCKVYRTVSQFYYPEFGWRCYPKKGCKARVSRIKIQYQLINESGVIVDNGEEEFSAKRVKSKQLVNYAYEVRSNGKVVGMETFISTPDEHNEVLNRLRLIYKNYENVELNNIPLYTYSLITSLKLNNEFNFY